MESREVCNNCGATVDETALCRRCGHDVARTRAEDAERATRDTRDEAGATAARIYRKRGWLMLVYLFSILFALGAAAALGYRWARLGFTGGGVYLVGTAALAAFGILMLWVFVRTARFRAYVTPNALVYGRLTIPLENIRFARRPPRYSLEDTSDEMYLYFRNARLKGPLPIHKIIQDHTALIGELQAVSARCDPDEEIELCCPYCGSTSFKHRAQSRRECPNCGNDMSQGMKRLNRSIRSVLTPIRIGFYIVSALAAGTILVLLSLMPRILQASGSLIAGFVLVLIVAAFGRVWLLAYNTYSMERQMITAVDSIIPVPGNDSPSDSEQ